VQLILWVSQITTSIIGKAMKKSNHLVMIHGLLGSMHYFSPDKYLEGITVHTCDLMGYGARQQDVAGTTLTIEEQARSVARYLRERVDQPCWLLGHSVGGAVTMLAAELEPARVRGIISVEGNFTLNDAFWCSKIAALPESDWLTELQMMMDDPGAWLRRSDIEPTPQRIEWARSILHNQPAPTIQAMARAVVKETSDPAYLRRVRSVVESGMPVCLLAGEKSASGWDVPAWTRSAARDDLIQKGAGHMMMLEDPATFCGIVRSIVER
jgi:pimeloyl-ACP methyl ester carboxylesterase